MASPGITANQCHQTPESAQLFRLTTGHIDPFQCHLLGLQELTQATLHISQLVIHLGVPRGDAQRPLQLILRRPQIPATGILLGTVQQRHHGGVARCRLRRYRLWHLLGLGLDLFALGAEHGHLFHRLHTDTGRGFHRFHAARRCGVVTV